MPDRRAELEPLVDALIALSDRAAAAGESALHVALVALFEAAALGELDALAASSVRVVLSAKMRKCVERN